MTCKEKLITEHPECDIDAVICNCCPGDFDYAAKPDVCYLYNDDDDDYTACYDCWNREIPETEETSESDGPRKVRDEHAFELAEKNARIAELEQRNKNQSDLIEKKTAELAISHARIAELTGELEESNKIKEEQLKVINELQARRNALEKELINEKERFENLKNHCEYLVDNHKRNLDAKDNAIKILEGKIAEHAERKIAEAFCSTSNSCALSADDIRHAIALSMFNKYHALLDAGFSNDDALKLTVMWKD